MDGRSVLIYDGDCAFCTKSVDFGFRHFDAWPESVPSQKFTDDQLDELSLSRMAVDAQVWLCLPGEPPLGGAAAVIAILGLQPNWGWRLVSNFARLPLLSCAAHAIYGWVARNRHKMPGASATCELPNGSAQK